MIKDIGRSTARSPSIPLSEVACILLLLLILTLADQIHKHRPNQYLSQHRACGAVLLHVHGTRLQPPRVWYIKRILSHAFINREGR